MILNAVLFVVFSIVAYSGISFFAQISGSASTPLSAFIGTLRPLPLIVVTIANMFFGVALFYGFGLTRFAIPITISIGAITSFIYSLLFLGAHFSILKAIGIALVVGGIVVLAL